MPRPVNADNPDELRSQLEQLQGSLAARQSILHFAHAGVATLVAFILGGAAAKLFWDSLRTPVLGFVAAAVALGLVVYGLTHYLKGRRELAGELKRYGDLLELRRRLRLDNPSLLLPR
ncbi:hypothetical protein SAMN05444354_11248 [Stigmatella aurantiaca]|uniref:DUF202 domain-containing protein n=1 Tax=Stigmatella aurantiaca TaxID=41 RepID=A0A1H7VWW9_STIAU|nr:hypothetical protein [Stigmatella aurantiaca]SEM13736.1 hypothetical protein SAMN05444354_11248 [Stigmatella aurantiaca]